MKTFDGYDCRTDVENVSLTDLGNERKLSRRRNGQSIGYKRNVEKKRDEENGETKIKITSL